MDVVRLRTTGPAHAKVNFAGFDAIRAFAALAVVLLHSCVPYLRYPMPGLAWPVRDEANSWVDFGFWSIELFIMPLFLTLAGFLSWQTLQRHGPAALIKSRARRLLKPLVFAILVVLPLDLYCWVLGWVAEGLVPPVKLRSLKFDGVIDRDLWGLSHLWFLQYLFLYVVGLAIVVSVRDRSTSLQSIKLGPRSLTALLLLAGTAVLYIRPEVVWGFQHSFLPVASKWIYSGLFFLFGVVLASHDGQLTRLRSSAGRFVMPAVLLSLAAVLLGRWHIAGGENELAEITLAALSCGAALLVTVSVIGIAVQRIGRVPSAVSYLAAASFWIYLIHHPIVGLVHLDLKLLLRGTSPVLKTAIAFTLTSGLSLLIYEGLVRRTVVGRLLGLTSGSSRGDGQQESRERALNDPRVDRDLDNAILVHADLAESATTRKAA